jgi:hypothetical protein
MKKHPLLVAIILILTLIGVWAYFVDSSQRQADVNLVSNIGEGFFEVDYPSFKSDEKGAIINFPIKHYYNDSAKKVLDANLTQKGGIMYMLNVPFDAYRHMQASYVPPKNQEPRVLPLLWVNRKSFGRVYWVYWGRVGSGYMSASEYNKFISKIKSEVNRAEQQVNLQSQP